MDNMFVRQAWGVMLLHMGLCVLAGPGVSSGGGKTPDGQVHSPLTHNHVQRKVSSTPAASLPQGRETPQQVVEILVSLPHGLDRLSEENRGRLEQVRRNPEPYITALRSLYVGRDIAAIGAYEDALRFERAIMLLGAVGSPGALSQLAVWYSVLEGATGHAAYAPNRDNMLRFRRLVFVALGRAKQNDIVTSVLVSLEKMDHATRIAALEYLARCCVGSRDVVNGLMRYLNDEHSPLYQDVLLKKALQLITGQQ